MNNNEVAVLTCGIMYGHSFSLLDKWGSIADDVLYHNSYFSTDYFPRISNQYTTSRSLHNDDQTHVLSLSANNLVYTHYLEKALEDEYPIFCDRVSNYLVPKIIDDNKLIVKRVGVVFTVPTSGEFIKAFSSKYFVPEYKNIVDFRFSKKEASTKAVMKGTDNYINKIITVGSIGRDRIGISFDYQYFYEPNREYIQNDVNRVLDNGKKSFEKEISIK